MLSDKLAMTDQIISSEPGIALERKRQELWNHVVFFWDKVNQAGEMRKAWIESFRSTLKQAKESETALFWAETSYFSHQVGDLKESLWPSLAEKTRWYTHVTTERSSLLPSTLSCEWQTNRLFYGNGFLQLYWKSPNAVTLRKFVRSWLSSHLSIRNLQIIALVKYLAVPEIAEHGQKLFPAIVCTRVGCLDFTHNNETQKVKWLAQDRQARLAELLQAETSTKQIKKDASADKKGRTKPGTQRLREIVHNTSAYFCWINDPLCFHAPPISTERPALISLQIDAFADPPRLQMLLRCGCGVLKDALVSQFHLNQISPQVVDLFGLPTKYKPVGDNFASLEEALKKSLISGKVSKKSSFPPVSVQPAPQRPKKRRLSTEAEWISVASEG